MRYIKCSLLVLLCSIIPMICRIIGIGILTKVTDDYGIMYKNAVMQYGLQSDEVKLVVDYGGVYFTWIGLLLILLFFSKSIYKNKLLSIDKGVWIYFSLGFFVSSILLTISNHFLDTTKVNIFENKGLWLICYALQAILLVFVEELIYRYKCLKYLEKDKGIVQYVVPLVLYLIVQGSLYEIILGVFFYSISYKLYKQKGTISYSLMFNLGLSISTLLGSICNEYSIILVVLSIVMVIISEKVRVWKS